MMDSVSAPATLLHVVSRLALAAGLGAAVGLNRELQEKPAGLRTHALVGLGAALMALVGVSLTGDATAPGRVLQGIVAGIGFIGGGAILRRGDPKGVHGLTTAASIWVVAGVGIAAGIGMWRSAAAAVVLALLVLIVGEPIDRRLHEGRLRSRTRSGG